MYIQDCAFASLNEAIRGTRAPREITDTLTLIEVVYYSFDDLLHTGQVVIHQDLAKDLEEIFAALRARKFPVGKVIPIVAYDWSDKASMEDNNSSGFNYRPIADTTRLSWHAYGRAFDLNPRQNPYSRRGKDDEPRGAVYDYLARGTLVPGGEALRLFTRRGWTWGGAWEDPIDRHHFEKS